MRNRIIVRQTGLFNSDRYRVQIRIDGNNRIYDSVSKHSYDRLLSKQTEFTHVYNAEMDVW